MPQLKSFPTLTRGDVLVRSLDPAAQHVSVLLATLTETGTL